MKVRSNAIRLVKHTFEAEGIEMPNPVYEVNLHREAGHARSRDARDSSPEIQPRDSSVEAEILTEDVAADAHLDEQIEREVTLDKERNLLTPPSA